MIKSYLVQLELRLQAVEKSIGNFKEYKDSEAKDIRDGITQVVAKVHKDASRKFAAIKKSIDKYSEVIDGVPTQQKLTLVHSQIDNLNAIAAQLDRIDKLIPALNTENYVKFRGEYANINAMNTCSTLQPSSATHLSVSIASEQSLLSARVDHRKAMNQIVELNGQIVKNLSLKLQSLKNRKLKESG